MTIKITAQKYLIFPFSSIPKYSIVRGTNNKEQNNWTMVFIIMNPNSEIGSKTLFSKNRHDNPFKIRSDHIP